MTQPLLIAFGLSFVVGPALCGLLLRLPPRLWSLVALALGVVGAVGLAVRMRVESSAMALPSLIFLWLAWVLAVTMVALALRRRITGPGLRRIVTIGALLATTLPWFGLATAQMMA